MANGNGVIEQQVRSAVAAVVTVYHQPEWSRWALAFLGEHGEISPETLLATAREVETLAALEWAKLARVGFDEKATQALAGRKAARSVWAWLSALANDHELARAREQYDQDLARSWCGAASTCWPRLRSRRPAQSTWRGDR